jgi:subtilase family serine protease
MTASKVSAWVGPARRPVFRVSWGFVVAAILVAGLTVTQSRAGAAGTDPETSLHVLPSLAVAQREASDVGPLPAKTLVRFTVALRERDVAGLQALLARGGSTTASQWTSAYGPDPTRVAGIRALLARAGLSSTWEPGDALLSVSGLAHSVERVLHLSIDRFVLHGSTHFYAPLGRPVLAKTIGSMVTAVTGLNDYPSHPTAAIASPDGVSPGQMTSFYDLTPLRKAGINGAGMTVIFPEWGMPPASVFAAFAAKFHLPAFHITVKSDPNSWGAPIPTSSSSWADVAGEASLDLEIVHGLAPGAREIVYEVGNPEALPEVIQTMTAANPGAILSSSIFTSWCENDGPRALSVSMNEAFAHAAAAGTSIFWASGDRGAFSCLPDGTSSTAAALSVNPNADSPDVTAVGGTTVYLAANGAYFKEAAWGEPLETWGSGGGISTIFGQPAYQVAPGLGPKTLGGRGVPDVSANADLLSGWDIFYPGQNGPQEGPYGGTSAATPAWAAMTALIDEDLAQQGLAKVGFANPALYDFARHPAGLPATAFHQVTEGSNFHFVSTPGWNAATGLGSPDVAHLADDFEWYDRTHQAAG